MRPLILVGIALLLVCPPLTSGDAPKGPVARKFAELLKSYQTEEKELRAKLAEATDPDDQKQIRFSLKELSAITASDAIELAVDNPKDEASIDAAVFAMKLLGEYKVTGRDLDKAVTFLLDNHINSPKLAGALAQMSDAGASGQHFLKTVAEKSTSKEVKGLAMFYCAIALDGQAASNEAQGNDDGAKKMRDEAIEMMEKAVKLAPDAKVGELTLTKAVEKELVAMRIGVGFPVPDVEGYDLTGKKVRMSSFKGKVVLFDFWATWCGPCVRMIPHERELHEKLSRRGFVLLSVSADTQKTALTDFLAKEAMPWSHWWDGRQGPLAQTFRIRAYPTMFLIDAKGIIRKKWIGAQSNEVLDKAIEELVVEAEKMKR